MTLSLIVAASENNAIGYHGVLPWHLPNDLAFFKNTTLHHTVIMGRTTFDTIGKPLPKRRNIVVTRQKNFFISGVEVVDSIDEAVALCKDEKESFIVGGAQIYSQSMQMVNKIYLTRVHQHFEGDAFFPAISPLEWRETARKDFSIDQQHAYRYSLLVYERK